jgi:hypothetical protein
VKGRFEGTGATVEKRVIVGVKRFIMGKLIVLNILFKDK